MSKEDILKIRTDIGLCADTLMAIFLYFCINTKLGIVYFFLSLILLMVQFFEIKIEFKITEPSSENILNRFSSFSRFRKI